MEARLSSSLSHSKGFAKLPLDLCPLLLECVEQELDLFGPILAGIDVQLSPSIVVADGHTDLNSSLANTGADPIFRSR